MDGELQLILMVAVLNGRWFPRTTAFLCRRAAESLRSSGSDKLGRQGLWGDRVGLQANIVVGRNVSHSKHSMAIRCATALLEPPLMGREGLTLHEKQGRSRKPGIRHRVIPVRDAPDVEKSRTNAAQPLQERLLFLDASTLQATAKRKMDSWVPRPI